MAAVPLTDVRARAAEALAPASDSDPDVFPDYVDAVQPPALLLEWNDPWVELRTVAGGAGFYNALLNVLCVVGRVDPGPALGDLEGLVSFVVGRFQADPISWALVASQAPREFSISDVPLLAARLTFRVAVAVEGG